MSYIAKVYLNKMFPKKDTLRIEGDMLVFTVFNVINPIVATDLPPNINEFFEIIGDDKPLAGKNKPEVFDQLKIVWGDKTINSKNYMSFKNQSMPTGEKFELFVPNSLGWKSGEEHKLTVKIMTQRPTVFTIERPVA